jgi:cytochrome c-type biogenesis protein CcmH/NrfG
MAALSMPRSHSLSAFSLVLVVAGALACSSGCWTNGYTANRGLHYVTDAAGEQLLVRTPPPAPAAYEAYLRARLALERDPPQLDAARGHIIDALRWQPDEPQLWTVRGEIEWRAGDFAAAEQALDRALALRPDYPEAKALQAQIRAPGATATAAK